MKIQKFSLKLLALLSMIITGFSSGNANAGVGRSICEATSRAGDVAITYILTAMVDWNHTNTSIYGTVSLQKVTITPLISQTTFYFEEHVNAVAINDYAEIAITDAKTSGKVIELKLYSTGASSSDYAAYLTSNRPDFKAKIPMKCHY